MNESAVIFTILGITLLTFCGLAALGLYLFRAHRPASVIEAAPVLPKPEVPTQDDEATEQAIVLFPDNVVTRLTFEQSLDASQFALTTRAAAESSLLRAVSARLGDGAEVAIGSVQLVQSWATMTVSASRWGQALLNNGTATIAFDTAGKRFPMLRDIKTGEWVEHMREAKGAKALGRVASLGAVVVGAAHIISGADIAKKLKTMDAKIDLLLAYRRIDQMSALERIYSSARELCAAPIDSQTSWELWRLRGELRELRIAWRRELEHQLSLVEDPQSASFFQKMFKWIEPIDRGNHSKAHQKITEGQLHIYLIEYALRLDQALAAASESIPGFEMTLAGEIEALENLAILLRSKASRISSKYPELSVEPTLKGMDFVISEYKALLGSPLVAVGDAQEKSLSA